MKTQIFSNSIHIFNYRCHHDQLENKTIDQIRNLYDPFERPSCSSLILDGENLTSISDEKCEKWIYNYEKGYESISTEVSCMGTDLPTLK